jgi:hypothetical protein
MMNKFRLTFHAAIFIAMTFALSSVSLAQATRTWVSGVGDDVNPCSRTAPCKTFAGAISKTAINGEIDALDPGGFGSVVITKSITIDGAGTLAGIMASGMPGGISINITGGTGAAGAAKTDAAKVDEAKTVRLRGLSINGAGSGVNGIRVIAANKVSIEDTVIDGFTANGINIETTGATQVFVKNTTIRNNAGSGINVAAGTSQVGMSDVAVVFNGTALSGPSGAIISFKNNVLYGNKKDGIPPAVPR